MDRYYIVQSFPSEQYFIMDKITNRTQGVGIVGKKRAFEICKWLNSSNLLLTKY